MFCLDDSPVDIWPFVKFRCCRHFQGINFSKNARPQHQINAAVFIIIPPDENNKMSVRNDNLFAHTLSGDLPHQKPQNRLLSILEKLSYQSANLVNPNHCPKGQLGQIWANFGQNWDRGRSRKNGLILEGKWGPLRWKIERYYENSKFKVFKGTTPNFG